MSGDPAAVAPSGSTLLIVKGTFQVQFSWLELVYLTRSTEVVSILNQLTGNMTGATHTELQSG